MLSKISYQVKTELKHNFLPLVLANLIIIGIAYFIFGLNNLDINTQGIIIERFLPLTGIFALVTLFYAEEKSPIKDILIMRDTRIEFIYLLRFLVRFLLYLISSLVYIILLSEETPIYELVKIFCHSISIGSLIGAAGVLIFSLSNNIALAFLTSIGLILAQWFAPKDKSNALLLFTMPEISVARIVFILGLSLIFLIVAINIWKKKPIS